jgi:hypothetical protein
LAFFRMYLGAARRNGNGVSLEGLAGDIVC